MTNRLLPKTTIAMLGTLSMLCQSATGSTPPCQGSMECKRSALEEMIVTGTRTPKILMRSPVSTSLVSEQDIDRASAEGLADILRDLPGVNVDDQGQAGLKRIRIRGEEARRIAILIDGQEVTDHREVGVPLTLDPTMVQRIEVVRGAGSVLYGAKAIGGVVNFITRKGGSEPVQGTLSVAYNSATRGDVVSGSVFGSLNGLDYRVSASRNEQGNRQTPVGEIDNTESESDGISLYLGKTFGDHKLGFSLDDFNSSSEVYVEEEVRTSFPLVDFSINAPQRDRKKAGIFYEAETDWGNLEKLSVNAYYQISDREFNTFPSTFLPFPPTPMLIDSEIYTSSELATTGLLAQLDWNPGVSHHLVTGIQFNEDRIDQDRHKVTNTVFNPGPDAFEAQRIEDVHDEASISTYALFAQDEWTLHEDYALTLGMRNYWVDGSLDETDRPGLTPGNLDDTHLIGSVSLVYTGIENTVVRLGAAQGYVYPSLLQLATGATAGSRYVNPNLDLTPESSVNYELGLRYNGAQWLLDTALFYSNAEDYIDHVACEVEDNCLGSRDKIYRNIGESTAYGLESHVSYRSSAGLTPYLTLTWLKRNNKTEQLDTYDSGLPEFSGRAGVSYEYGLNSGSALWADAYLRGESSADELEVGSSGLILDHNPGWTTYNLSFGMDIGKNKTYRIALDVNNLTNKTYSTAAENLIAPERSVLAKFILSL